jgi:hypothetical protein
MDNVAVNIWCVNRDAGVGLHLALRARAVPFAAPWRYHQLRALSVQLPIKRNWDTPAPLLLLSSGPFLLM